MNQKLIHPVRETRDLESSLRDAFSLNESCNEASRQTLLTRSSSFLEPRQILHLAIMTTGDKSGSLDRDAYLAVHNFENRTSGMRLLE